MKKTLLSVILASIINAASPMVSTSMSTDNGGTKLAIDAYSDGGGVLLINQASDTKVDNSAMNKLVFKYGDAAKSSNTTLKNQVNVLSPSATALEKSAATTTLEVAKVVINPPINGASCDDGSSLTSNDIWINGLCKGSIEDGLACNDNIAATYDDKYTSNICSGTYITSCNTMKSINPAATDGVYVIDLDGPASFQEINVYCDMTTDGGGWTLVGNQVPSSLLPDDIIIADINSQNFGSLTQSYRFGNQAIQKFTPTVGWRMQARDAAKVVQQKAYINKSCVIDWANNIEDFYPSYDSVVNFGKSCGVMYNDLAMTTQYTKIIQSAAMGIGSNNAGANCSMRFAGVPQKYCPSGSSCYGSMGWAQPCVTSQYTTLSMQLWVK